ncbi:MAG: hypothetical protein P8176_11690 [Gammaproteobacteria bacterium]
MQTNTSFAHSNVLDTVAPQINPSENQALAAIDPIDSQTIPQALDASKPHLRQATVNGLSPDRLSQLFEKSQGILDHNQVIRNINGEDYTGTMPSREYYVHQWFWDSATHAIALAETQPERALDELASLSMGQWRNGFMGHINFFPDTQEKIYFPGAQFWKTEQHTPTGTHTSSITQPPIFNMAVPKVLNAVLKDMPTQAEQRTNQQQKIMERASKVLDSALAFTQFLATARDPEDSGLITIVHPWESGLDNAPSWDEPLKHSVFDEHNIPQHVKTAVDQGRRDVVKKTTSPTESSSTPGTGTTNTNSNTSERPLQKQYYDYMTLVDQYNQLGSDQNQIPKVAPFRVKDVLFTSIFSKGCAELGKFYRSDTAQRLSLANERHAEWLDDKAQASQRALSNTWDDDMARYLNLDLNADSHEGDVTQPMSGLGKPIRTDTISGFAPLLAGLGKNEQRTARLLNALDDPMKYKLNFSVPTTAKDNPAFDIKRYWRGSVWPITNFLTIRGLESVQQQHQETNPPLAQQATRIKQRLLNDLNQLVDTVGFQEYYIPTAPLEQQRKIGFGAFSWTAAIFMITNADAYRQITQQGATRGND